MKQITAIIQPHRLSRVRAAARRMRGFPGMTVDKVEGFSVEGEDGPSGIKGELTEYSPKVRLTVLASDDLIDAIVELIATNCHTGEKGDGVIWVKPVELQVRIRDVPRNIAES